MQEASSSEFIFSRIRAGRSGECASAARSIRSTIPSLSENGATRTLR